MTEAPDALLDVCFSAQANDVTSHGEEIDKIKQKKTDEPSSVLICLSSLHNNLGTCSPVPEIIFDSL